MEREPAYSNNSALRISRTRQELLALQANSWKSMKPEPGEPPELLAIYSGGFDGVRRDRAE
jgi:hypothetical protein